MAEKQNPLEEKMKRLLFAPLPPDSEVYTGLREARIREPSFADAVIFEQIRKAIFRADTAAAKFCMEYFPGCGDETPLEGAALEEFLNGLSYSQLLRLAAGGDAPLPPR